MVGNADESVVLELNGGSVDLRARRGVVRGEEFKLTSREAALLRYLAARPGQTVPTDELLIEVWEYAPGVVSRAVHNTVRRLRNKIEDEPKAPAQLLTEHGVGFRWELPTTTLAARAHGAAVQDDALPREAVETWAPSVEGRFVGRAREMEAVLSLLASGARLVTLVGAGGIGKTRLAAEAARRLVGLVRYVPLAGARSGSDVLRLVARSLGVRLGREPLEAVCDALRGLGEATVVLDNLEQVAAEARPLVERWLVASRVRLVATSRIVLGLGEERVVEVPPLGVEAARFGGPSDTGGLLLARVAELDPVAAGRASSEEVERLAALLAGLPLAVELAAPWVVERGFAPVTEALANAPVRLGDESGGHRHASLRACLDWGWGLLPQRAQDSAVSVSVLEADFDLDAAAAVLGADGASEALDCLGVLADASFLRERRTRAGRRWAWLPPVRAYVRDAAGGELQGAQVRHARWFARLGADRFLAELDAEACDGRRRLESAVEDLRAACRVAASGRFEPEVRGALTRACVSALLGAGDVRGAAEVVAETRAAHRHDGIAALRGAGGMAALLGIDDLLDVEIGEARAGNLQRLPVLLMILGAGQHDLGDHREAAATFREAAAVARDHGMSVFAAECDGYAANSLACAGNVPDAEIEFARALRELEAAGNPRPAAIAYSNYGILAWRSGGLEDAAQRFDRAVALGRRWRDLRATANASANAAMVYAKLGRFEEAGAGYDAAVSHAELSGNRRMLARVLVNRAELDRVVGEFDRAERDFRRAIALADDLAIQTTRWIARIDLALLFMELGMVGRIGRLLDDASLSDANDEGRALAALLAAGVRAARDDDAARRELLRASEGERGAHACVILAWAERRADREEDARSALERALVLLDEHPDVALRHIVSRASG